MVVLDGIMSGKHLNGVSILWIGFMHMLSIVHMLYLSSKSPSVHMHRRRNENDDIRKSGTAPWAIAY